MKNSVLPMFPSQFSEPDCECIAWDKCRWTIDAAKRLEISKGNLESEEIKQKIIKHSCGTQLDPNFMVKCCSSDQVSLDETQVFTIPKQTTTATSTRAGGTISENY